MRCIRSNIYVHVYSSYGPVQSAVHADTIKCTNWRLANEAITRLASILYTARTTALVRYHLLYLNCRHFGNPPLNMEMASEFKQRNASKWSHHATTYNARLNFRPFRAHRTLPNVVRIYLRLPRAAYAFVSTLRGALLIIVAQLLWQLVFMCAILVFFLLHRCLPVHSLCP